jgi:L-iditol 2-dehydrogenase
MPEMMDAVFFDGPGKLAIRQIEAPVPGPGDVIVDVQASGICGSDVHQLEGRWPQPPFVLGHEIAGAVSMVGEGISEALLGTAVCVEPFLYCGKCRFCRAGRYLLCPQMGFLTLTEHGGFAAKVRTPAYSVYALPGNVSMEVGALAEPLAVAVHGARLASVSSADDVLVIGAGTIGLMAVAVARHFGARRVRVTARHSHQAEAARMLGADEVLGSGGPFDGDDAPDVVIETVGSAASTFQTAINAAGKLGRVVLIGGNTGTMDGVDLKPIVDKELTLYGSGAYGQIGLRADFELARDILRARPEVFERLITHRFPLAQIEAAFDAMLHKKDSGAIKVMIVS